MERIVLVGVLRIICRVSVNIGIDEEVDDGGLVEGSFDKRRENFLDLKVGLRRSVDGLFVGY